MATYVVSDLHGYSIDKWEELVARAGITPQDRLYVLGDVIDRGEHGVALLEWMRCCKDMTITAEGESFNTFMKALNTVTIALCRKIAGDGEGATKLLECIVTGADDLETARTCAKSVICSSLLKAAMFGADANWGRVLCAIGYSGAKVDVNKIGVSFKSAKGQIEVCRNGASVPFSEEKAKEILLESEIEILVSLGSGSIGASAWGCDLTYDYVKINGDYRT